MNFEIRIKHVAKTTRDMWDRGWAEANGGNVSLRLNASGTGLCLQDGLSKEATGFCTDLPTNKCTAFFTQRGHVARGLRTSFRFRPNATG